MGRMCVCVCKDIRILSVKNWRSVALNREEWRIILRKARAVVPVKMMMMMMMIWTEGSEFESV
jgi:hypothetical protein